MSLCAVEMTTERQNGWYWIRYRASGGLCSVDNEWCPAFWWDGRWGRIATLDYVSDADEILEVCPTRIEPPAVVIQDIAN